MHMYKFLVKQSTVKSTGHIHDLSHKKSVKRDFFCSLCVSVPVSGYRCFTVTELDLIYAYNYIVVLLHYTAFRCRIGWAEIVNLHSV